MEYEKIFLKKLITLFVDEAERETVLNVLNTYGEEVYEQETFRVRLAILKLSGNNIKEIKKITAFAKQDFRDVLSWAEYPRQSKKWSLSAGPEKQKMIEEDRKEYEKWLKT